MPIFTDYDYYAPQFWIAARYLESLSMLAGFGLLETKRRINPTIFLVIYLAITAWLVASILYYKTFPICFIAGKGLTPFKIVSEYIICVLFAGSIVLLYIRRVHFDARVFRQILAALVLMICMELCFTLYVSDAMSDAFNEIGHLLKICAFYLIYKAIVVTALRDPINLLFRELGASERRLREAQQLAHLGRWELDVNTRVWTWTEEMYRFFSVALSSAPYTRRRADTAATAGSADAARFVVPVSFSWRAVRTHAPYRGYGRASPFRPVAGRGSAR